MKIQDLIEYINFRKRQGFDIQRIVHMMNSTLHVYATLNGDVINVTVEGEYFTLSPGRLSSDYALIS